MHMIIEIGIDVAYDVFMSVSTTEIDDSFYVSDPVRHLQSGDFHSDFIP